tara:strand:+ start:158 stop:1051 length:894 start_codon:yes stop_codon:yes gene_type:complete
MASDFCNIPPQDETRQILSLLPSLPSIQRLVNVILQKVNDVKTKYTAKIEEFLSQFELGCPTPQKIEEIVKVRNKAIDELTKLYESTNRIADNISGVSGFIALIITIIKVAQTTIGVASLTQLVAPFIPATILAKINAATEIAQGVIDKVRFKTDGSPRLVPIVNGIISANIAIQLLVSALRDLICKLEALDPQILACAEEAGIKDIELVPISPTIISFVEESLEENQSSTIETTYRGFIFEIEEVPFSPTVNRTQANALNKDGIIMLQSELSFTTEPSILIEELKFVINRDNLKAE